MGLVRYTRCSGRYIDVLKDLEFHDIRATLDSEMKRLQSKGVGSSKRQAEVITVEEEETLWRNGFLGKSNPQVLLDTIIYYCGLTLPCVVAKSIGSYKTRHARSRWWNGQEREPTYATQSASPKIIRVG